MWGSGEEGRGEGGVRRKRSQILDKERPTVHLFWSHMLCVSVEKSTCSKFKS